MNDFGETCQESVESVEKFYFNFNEYLSVRNSLSHPASTKILTTEAISVLSFVKKFCQNVDDVYFWFIDKESILKQIKEFHISDNFVLKKENLSEIVVLQATDLSDM